MFNNVLQFLITVKDMTTGALSKIKKSFDRTIDGMSKTAKRSFGLSNVQGSLIRGVFGGNLLMKGVSAAMKLGKELLFASKQAEDLAKNIKAAMMELTRPIRQKISDTMEAWNLGLTGKIEGKTISDWMSGVKVATPKAVSAERMSDYFKGEYETEAKIKRRVELMEQLRQKEFEYSDMRRKMVFGGSKGMPYDLDKLSKANMEYIKAELEAAKELGSTWEMVSQKAGQYNLYAKEYGGKEYTQESWEEQAAMEKEAEKAIAEMEKAFTKKKEEMIAFLKKQKEDALDSEIDKYKDLEKQIMKTLDADEKRLEAMRDEKLLRAEQLREISGQQRYLALNEGARKAQKRASERGQKEEKKFQSILANAARKMNANARRRGHFGIPLSEAEQAAVASEQARLGAGEAEKAAKELQEKMLKAEEGAWAHLASIDGKIEKLLVLKD